VYWTLYACDDVSSYSHWYWRYYPTGNRVLQLVIISRLRVFLNSDRYILRRGRPQGRDFVNGKKCVAWANIILARKSDSRGHSTTRFSENVMEAEISYQMLEVLSFCDRERVQTPSIKITVLTFLLKKCSKTFRAYYFLRRGKKTSESSMLTNFRIAPCERNICRERKQHEIRDKKSYYPVNTAHSHRSTPSGRDIRELKQLRRWPQR